MIVGADQTERSKPHPEPYQTAFARLRSLTGRDLDPWRSVAIEDSRWGLVSARGADLRCVAVTNTYSAAELRADAELVVPGLHALTLDGAGRALCRLRPPWRRRSRNRSRMRPTGRARIWPRRPS